MKPEKPTRAVALRYDRSKDGAPRVVAKGQGTVADNIIAVAREHGVPLHEDPNLAATLNALDLETEIPPELYRAVAEVLIFIYRLNGRLNGP
jgi:flagellar biosynthesis protein